jgi:phosphoribosylanthranilate isomerase
MTEQVNMDEIDGTLSARTRIKVCGITRLNDAMAASAVGVDGLGFIFIKKSPRYIEPDQAREIVRQLPPFVDAVGVFLNEEATVVQEIARYCRLTLVQLHGEETPAYCRSLSRQVLKVVRVGPDFDQAILRSYEEAVHAFLFDTFHKEVAGGTGLTFDWDLLAEVQPHRPVILAGGLHAGNVAEAIRQVKPYAVDVNSGVESAPGIKDFFRLQQFVDMIRKTDAESV